MKLSLVITIIASFFAGCAIISAQTTASLIPKKGLYVTTDKINWISGSEVSFFTPDKKHHHYYFTWWEQDVDSTINDKTELLIGSQNTAVSGVYSLTKSGDLISTHIDCEWKLKENGVADIVYAKIWLPFVQNSEWSDGKNEFNLNDYKKFNDTVLIIKTPFGHFRISSSHPFQIKKNDFPNPASDDYDKRSQCLYLFENDISQKGNTRLLRNFEITQLDKNKVVGTTPLAIKTLRKTVTIPDAWTPDIKPNEILPKPKSIIENGKYYSIPKTRPEKDNSAETMYRKALSRLWNTGNFFHPKIIIKKDLSLPDEGYSIETTPDNIIIFYKTDQGLQHAIATLVQMTININQELVIPLGLVKDQPVTSWRGIHMFTGPNSLALHKKMYERILIPLKMNKVVLQCEQAEWTSQPFIRKGIAIALKDLKADFEYLRKHHIEPIPLIQSLGHMEWFFKPKSNRYLAVNPSYPYTLNAELPQARAAIKKIWDETFSLLKPKTIHIGFDEIGMIGFHLPREKEIDLWKIQMKNMVEYAGNHNAKLMIWGDMALAPGEGPDALNGKTKKRATLLRSTIPPGTYIADWHYLNDNNPAVYKPNLMIWKENKNIPIASPWLHPDNIYGFVHAAIDEKAGVLQTTWADFESSEHNMLINIEQFGAYILALDYAWSGRKELPAQLPYHPVDEWNRRFFRQALPVTSLQGTAVIENLSIPNACKTFVNDYTDSAIYHFESEKIFGLKMEGSTDIILPEASTVAWLRFYDNKKLLYEKQLRYGVEIRAKQDKRPVFAHIPGKGDKILYDFPSQVIRANQVRIENIHPCSGLEVKNLLLLHD